MRGKLYIVLSTVKPMGNINFPLYQTLKHCQDQRLKHPLYVLSNPPTWAKWVCFYLMNCLCLSLKGSGGQDGGPGMDGRGEQEMEGFPSSRNNPIPREDEPNFHPAALNFTTMTTALEREVAGERPLRLTCQCVCKSVSMKAGNSLSAGNCLLCPF